MEEATTLATLVKRIRRSNNRFNVASDAQRRVMLAKDVLASLEAKRLVPASCTYVDSLGDVEQAKEVIEKYGVMPTCTACALGGLFIALLDRAGDKREMRSSLHPYSDEVYRRLELVFSKTQLKMIEVAYEADTLVNDLRIENRELAVACLNFSYCETPLLECVSGSRRGPYYGVEDRREARLTKVMKNIIRNKGTFDPCDTRD